MSERVYFDCHASYGPRTGMHPEERWTLDHLREDLDLAGIAGALVCHAQGLLYDPMLSNRRLTRELASWRETLIPCWTVHPALGGDMPEVAELERLLAGEDIRAVRLEPRVFGLPLDRDLWTGLLAMLRERQTLVVTGLEGWPPDWDALDQFLGLLEGLPVIYFDAHWSQWRRFAHLMNRHPHLHLEFATFQANRAIEYFAGTWGADRCLFGTGLPQKAPGAARGFLDWTLLPEDQASKIAGGNLRRLLRGAGPTQAPRPGPWHDALTAAARAGQPLPCVIWDDHCHVLHEGGSHAGGTLHMHEGGPRGMIELIRRVGIEKTAVMSWAGPLSGDADTGNALVAEAVRHYPDEFFGLVTIRPESQTRSEIEATIRRYHLELKFPGLKPFPRDTLDFDHPLFAPWFEFADRLGLYMVYDPCRWGEAGVGVIENLTRRYPRLALHLDHCGQSWPYARWAVDMVRRFPQVYAQLNYTAVTNGVIEYLAAEAGPDRLLFGTDAPMRDPRPQAGWLAFTRLSEDHKRQIFGLNFRAQAMAALARLEQAAPS
jgi:predicted TIM-barrel fold metal-dependent hydrolase